MPKEMKLGVNSPTPAPTFKADTRSSPVKKRNEQACAGDVRSTEKGAQAANETVGTKATIVRKNHDDSTIFLILSKWPPFTMLLKGEAEFLVS